MPDSPRLRVTEGAQRTDAETVSLPVVSPCVDSLFDGLVWRPGDDRYEAARANWHEVDSRPALIVEAASERDVGAALRVAIDHGLPVAVQSSGHGAFTPCDGSLLLRTSGLRGMTVDPQRRRARVGAGVLLREVMAAAAPFGLAPLSGSTPWLGAAGFTLGGGVGWLTRRYGYAADSLAGADVVTSAGQAVRADADHEADLLWGLRGAGGCLGVVTSIDIELYMIPELFGGVVIFAGMDLFDVLARYRDWAAELPDELSTALVLRVFQEGEHVPAQWNTRTIAALRVLFQGSPDDAERHLAPFRAAAGREVASSLRVVELTSRAAAAQPRPMLPRGGAIELFRDVPDALLAELADVASAPEAPLSLVELRHWGGAICRERARTSPAGPRDVHYGITVETHDALGVPGEDTSIVDVLMTTLRRYSTGAAMRNLLTDAAQTHRAYATPNRARLSALKRAWDPHDLFRVGHRIPPDGWPKAEGGEL